MLSRPGKPGSIHVWRGPRRVLSKASTFPGSRAKIDWASVRSGGTQFAFIKATEGGTLVDERFVENWTAAKQAGVSRGAYHFMFWCRPADEQAAWFKRTVPSDPDALPPVLDLEWNAQSPSCPRRLSRGEALAQIKVM